MLELNLNELSQKGVEELEIISQIRFAIPPDANFKQHLTEEMDSFTGESEYLTKEGFFEFPEPKESILESMQKAVVRKRSKAKKGEGGAEGDPYLTNTKQVVAKGYEYAQTPKTVGLYNAQLGLTIIRDPEEMRFQKQSKRISIWYNAQMMVARTFGLTEMRTYYDKKKKEFIEYEAIKGYNTTMLTLTFENYGDWQPKIISNSMRRVERYINKQREGAWKQTRTCWVAEIQEGRAEKYGEPEVHYHVLLIHPKDIKLPKNERNVKKSFWDHGWAKVDDKIRSGAGYLVSYVKKGKKSKWKFPKGCRTYHARSFTSLTDSIYLERQKTILELPEWVKSQLVENLLSVSDRKDKHYFNQLPDIFDDDFQVNKIGAHWVINGLLYLNPYFYDQQISGIKIGGSAPPPDPFRALVGGTSAPQKKSSSCISNNTPRRQGEVRSDCKASGNNEKRSIERGPIQFRGSKRLREYCSASNIL